MIIQHRHCRRMEEEVRG